MVSVDTGEGPAATVPRATVSHAIFDMDGLLLDTEGFYTEVQEKILARYGKVFDWSLKAKMMGKKATESAHIFIDECGLASLLTPEQFLEEREGMLQELFPSCAVLPVWMDAARIADSSCFPQYNASLKCLETNQDKSKCQQQFDDYKECKKRECHKGAPSAYAVNLKLLAAKDLIVANLNGSSDPYALITCGEDKRFSSCTGELRWGTERLSRMSADHVQRRFSGVDPTKPMMQGCSSFCCMSSSTCFFHTER